MARRVHRVPPARRDGGQLRALVPGILCARAPLRSHAHRSARRILSEGLPRLVHLSLPLLLNGHIFIVNVFIFCKLN